MRMHGTTSATIRMPWEKSRIAAKMASKRKHGGDYCAAINCHNSRYNSSYSLFRFPKDPER